MGRPAKRVVILDKDEERGSVLAYSINIWGKAGCPFVATWARTGQALEEASGKEFIEVVIAADDYPRALAAFHKISPDTRILMILSTIAGAPKSNPNLTLYGPTQAEIRDSLNLLAARKRGPRKGTPFHCKQVSGQTVG